MASADEWLALADKCVEKTIAYASEEWKLHKQTKGITIYSHKVDGIHETIFKAICDIDASPERVAKCVKPGPDTPRSKWDQSAKSWKLVAEINDSISVLQTITHSAAMGLIASRDFVDLSVWRPVANTGDWICAATSISHPDAPETPGMVRGFNHPCGFYMQALDGGKRTHFTYVVHTALGGSLPTSLVESALPGAQTAFFDELRKYLAKNPE